MSLNNKASMLVKTRVFQLSDGKYNNLCELAEAMEISVNHVYRVRQGKRNINQKFIIGTIKTFPGYRFDDLFIFPLMRQWLPPAIISPVS
jgi:hypothetical protein